jgi:hypothetical protein
MNQRKQYALSEWLDPRIEIRPSPIGGQGLFARAPIAVGEPVVLWGGTVYTRAEVEAGKPPGWVQHRDGPLHPYRVRHPCPESAATPRRPLVELGAGACAAGVSRMAPLVSPSIRSNVLAGGPVRVQEQRSCLKPCQSFEISRALPCAPVIAGLVLGTYQRVGAARALGDDIKVTPVRSDRPLQMLTVRFGRLERPRFSAGIGQELAEQRATWAVTGERARSRPITRRLQGLGDACPQVRHADAAQEANGRQAPACLVQAEQRRDEDRVRIVCLGPRQHVVRQRIGETSVDVAQGGERINDDCLVD